MESIVAQVATPVKGLQEGVTKLVKQCRGLNMLKQTWNQSLAQMVKNVQMETHVASCQVDSMDAALYQMYVAQVPNK